MPIIVRVVMIRKAPGILSFENMRAIANTNIPATARSPAHLIAPGIPNCCVKIGVNVNETIASRGKRWYQCHLPSEEVVPTFPLTSDCRSV